MATFERDTRSGLVWIFQEALVEPLSAFNIEGGHAKVQKVRNVGVDHVSNWVFFAAKLSKHMNMYKRGLETSTTLQQNYLENNGVLSIKYRNTRGLYILVEWWITTLNAQAK